MSEVCKTEHVCGKTWKSVSELAHVIRACPYAYVMRQWSGPCNQICRNVTMFDNLLPAWIRDPEILWPNSKCGQLKPRVYQHSCDLETHLCLPKMWKKGAAAKWLKFLCLEDLRSATSSRSPAEFPQPPQIYLSKLQYVFVPIVKCICPNSSG